MWQRLAWMSMAGVLGTLARYGLGVAVQRVLGNSSFPWGTLAVNVLGCFLFGVVWTAADQRLLISAEARMVLLVGFMGAFTTFSSFAFESGQLLRDAQWTTAAANVLLQNGLGLGGLFLGFKAGQIV